MRQTKVIYTIGHSTLGIDDFIHILKTYKIKLLVDIRRLPGSSKYPQFNQLELKNQLLENNIQYEYLEALGGRRRAKKDSLNTRWKNASFRGYADYMETDEFAAAIKALQAMALKKRTAYMCAEVVWWRCHRSMVSDYLKARGWQVLHIFSASKAVEHPFTKPAIVKGAEVCYRNE